jgi:5-bromo-4-chloroindolyl phosphate hydrolysis protein
MTLHDLVHGWVPDKSIPIARLIASTITMIVTIITAIWAAGYFVSNLATKQETLTNRIDITDREVTEIKRAISGLPERMTNVEKLLEKTDSKQDDRFEQLKTLIVQTRPKNSAPSLQTTRRQ